MGLGTGSGGSGAYMKGVFVNKRKIMDVGNLSGTEKIKTHVAIKLFFEPVQTKAGKTFEPNMMVFGDFEKNADGTPKVDATGAPTGWGSAFKVDRLINHIGGWNGELLTPAIPEEALVGLVGKEVYALQYFMGWEDGYKRYRDYQILALPVEKFEGKEMDGGDWLLASFKNQLAQGRIQDFHPELLDAEGSAATEKTVDL